MIFWLISDICIELLFHSFIYLHLSGYIESNTGKSARQGNLRHPRVRFQSFADEAPCLALFAGV
jgi:hypothetical protein